MANPNVTEIITKIIIRNDIFENWEVSKIVLEKGEPAFEMNLEKMIAKLKVGDGIHTFKELPYSTITPEEVQTMINEALSGNQTPDYTPSDVKSVTLSSGTNNGTLKLTVNGIEYDNIEVTGLGSAAFTNASDYATAEQGARADIAVVYKGPIDKLPDTDVHHGDTFTVISAFTIPADKSETGIDMNVVTGDKLYVKNNGKYHVIPAGASDVAKSLSEGISASISGGVTGTATPANAGESIDITVSEVNTDYLKQGTKIIIINGGNATTE